MPLNYVPFGTDPLVSSSGDSAIPQMAIEKSLEEAYPQIEYRRSSNATDVVFQVEWSDDLEVWQSGGGYLQPESTTDLGGGMESVEVRSQTAVKDASKQFMRLRVQQP
ncbi:hypothetical protein [Rubritalea tangerina]|uniref:hypothetical protein n=1 Tax=Rubritalea tangerina TaxID=430798 RepID=UPI00360726D8